MKSLRKFLSSKFGKFALVGAFAFLVDAVVLTVVIEIFGLRPEAARIVSFIAAVATTWYLNRTYTFASTAEISIGEFMKYTAAMSLGLAVNYLVFVIVIQLSPLANSFPVIALVPATLSGMIINFLTSRRLLDR